jgi:hypothetical protein
MQHLAAKAVDLMRDRENRVSAQHPRTRIPHDLRDLLFLGGLVAVNGAIRARGFGITVRAFVQAPEGVAQKRRAIGAGCLCVLRMLGLAIEAHHLLDGLFFTLYMLTA